MIIKVQKFLPLVSLVFSLFLLFSALFTVLSINDQAIMTGLEAIFGGEIASIAGFASADVNFSFLNFIAFFLPALLTIGIAIYGMKNQETNTVKSILGIVLTIVFILSIILISTMANNTTATLSVMGSDTTFSYEGANLAIGSILALIFAILGTVSSTLYSVMQFAKK
ncbi:MAG: hypothetical protein PHW21_00015 [Candidatus Izemoplasmatales bacterium]|nr:hypothetical protein [Candidatus Izemoplasmatales bacterium]MDY0138144.1 hypothetical protein [Candidatus Izemoplasmatales bacterium]